MIYYENIKRQLTQQELDGNFEQLMLRARKLGAGDMSLTLRKDLTRPLTAREMDSNFQSLDLSIKRALYGDGPYPSADFIFDGATVLPAGLTFSRPGEATYIKNGKLLTAGIDEPVFERGGLRLWPSVTNLAQSHELPTFAKNAETSYEFGKPDFKGGTDAYEIVNTAQGSAGHIYSTAFRNLLDNIPFSLVYYFRQEDVENFITVTGFSKFPAHLSGPEIGLKTFTVERFTDNMSDIELIQAPDGSVWGRVELLYEGIEKVNYTYSLRIHEIEKYIPGMPFRAVFAGIHHHQGMSVGSSTMYIPPATTMPADNARIEGAAFSSIFNPNQGALVLPHSSFGEGNIITLDGLNIARTEDGLELNGTAIPDTEDAKQNLKLRWGSNGLDVFVGNIKSLHDIPLPANWGDADSLVLADNDSAGKYIDKLAMLTEAPTDSNMEGM